MQWTDDQGRREIEIWSQQQVNGHMEGWEGGGGGFRGGGTPAIQGVWEGALLMTLDSVEPQTG